ncbi:MAG: hypothetical protein DWI02_08210 [Planctomycetota bacterium]|nr:MAG: hypothetical protein DWI02_08210 [Planctomycetota bacterium]
MVSWISVFSGHRIQVIEARNPPRIDLSSSLIERESEQEAVGCGFLRLFCYHVPALAMVMMRALRRG